MKPMWVIVCVCWCGYCIYVFPGNVKVSRSKEINISSFFDTEYHTSIDCCLSFVKSKKKKKTLQTHNSAIQWTHFPCAPVCYSTHDWASAFDQSCFGWFEIFGLDTDINIHALANTLTHTIFPICFFSPQMIDEYSFWCIDWMLLWNYIFGAGWALEERQIGLTKWE